MTELFDTSVSLPKGRTLDFDIETRRIGFHNGGRFNPDGCEPVAIAWKWLGEPERPIVRVMDREWSAQKLTDMVALFYSFYEAADMVTGHYIRKFDLPILNGTLMELGLPELPGKLTLDTKLDLGDRAGFSQSQENLSTMLQLERSKFHMNDTLWREVARLTDYGLTDARVRVVDDVLQHEQLYKQLVEAGRLGSPRWWKP